MAKPKPIKARKAMAGADPEGHIVCVRDTKAALTEAFMGNSLYMTPKGIRYVPVMITPIKKASGK